MAQYYIQEQVSISLDSDEIPDSTSFTDECESSYNPFEFFTRNGMVKLEERMKGHYEVKKLFLQDMGRLATDTKIVAIHKNYRRSFKEKARMKSYDAFLDAVAQKCGGHANVRCAWYGVPKNQINDILCHGFFRCDEHQEYGVGLHLSPWHLSLNSVLSSECDENGLRHVLLCRVIMGQVELIRAGSRQIQPSSMEFDSGVDNLVSPTKYIMWSCYMNSHINIDTIVSFQVPSGQVFGAPERNAILPTLLELVLMFSHPTTKLLIEEHKDAYKNRMITSVEFTDYLNQLVHSNRQLFAASKLYNYEAQI